MTAAPLTRSRTDTAFLVLTGLFVGGIAVVAGAISFAHMVDLAGRHDQTGWKAYAFPVSVDGLEIVASLYLVAQRRAGRATGVIPWVALVVGTLASLTANVAVGGHDVIGKALAGWPALSMLAAVKLFFAMFDHEEGDQRPSVRDDQRTSTIVPETSPTVPDVPGTVHRTGRAGPAPSGTVPTDRTDELASSGTDRPAKATVDTSAVPGDAGQPATGHASNPGDRAAPVDIRAVAHLIPAARAARATLANGGRSLSRDALADAIRDDGHGVSNARASLLLRILRAEEGLTALGPVPPATTPDQRPDAAAA
jgi:hypothetical protein